MEAVEEEELALLEPHELRPHAAALLEAVDRLLDRLPVEEGAQVAVDGLDVEASGVSKFRSLSQSVGCSTRGQK